MTVEAVVRDYLRADTKVMGLLNNDERRLNMDWSGADTATRVTLYRTSGHPNDYYPVETSGVTLHCYGSTRPAAADLADQIAATMRNIAPTPGSSLLNASVESITYLPTADGVARYVVTTVVTAKLTVPVA